MSEKNAIKLFTPNTGLPDLELKIAYGLCRVAFEAGLDFTMRPRQGWWEVEVKGQVDRLETSFNGILIRMMSASGFFRLPGFGGKARPENMVYTPTSKVQSLTELYAQAPTLNLNYKATSSFRSCGHSERNYDPFGGTSGLLLGTAFPVSKVLTRDGLGRSNLGLCETCGWLASLGYSSVALRFSAGESSIVILPEPEGPVDRKAFQGMLSIQRDLGWHGFPEELGMRDLPLVILAQYPHLSDFMSNQNLRMAIYILKKNQSGSWGTSDARSTRIESYAGFIRGLSDSYEPHNIALIRRMSWNINDTKGIFPLLSKALNIENKAERRRFASLFARELSANMDKDSEWVFLLPRKTAKYLLEEVMNMESEIYENAAVNEVANLLRYFVKKRNYQFVDDIRNAKEPLKVKEVLAIAVRKAESLGELKEKDGKKMYLDSEGKYVPHVSDEAIKSLVKLMDPEDEGDNKRRFEEVKYALAILAFARHGRGDDTAQEEISKEVSS